MRRCLAINSNFIPIRIINKYEAICKVFIGNATAITFEENNFIELNFNQWIKKEIWPDDQEFIYSTSIKLAIPRVIRYLHYSKIPKTTVRLSRKTIFARDENICYICGKEFSDRHLSIDHIIPISRGGTNTWKNMITCCLECNWKKGDKLLHELGIKPKFQAKEPVVSNISRLKLNYSRDYKEWEYFGL